MGKLRAILVDDELAARNVMSNLLELAHPDVEIVAKCPNLPEAVMAIRSLKPDVVFLDVEMPQFSGYEIVNFFDEFDFQIVFVTAYDKYAIKAFEVSAIDYLLKPVERKRLDSTIQKVKDAIDKNKKLVNYRAFLEKRSKEDAKTIVLTEAGKQKVIKTSEISSIQANGAYSEVHLIDGTKITVSKNIGSLEDAIKDDSLFVRTHKSSIVNVSEILTVKKTEETIQMKNGIVCKLSRFKKVEFQKTLESFLEKTEK